jgi:betaine-aldehyde dehydrogenase
MRLPSNMDLYYGGTWHIPNGGYAPTFDPASGRVLADAPVANATDVDSCVESAWSAFPSWRTSAAVTRAAALRQIAKVIRSNIADVAMLDSANNGNPVAIIGRNLEYAVDLVDYFATLALEIKGSTYPNTPGALRFSVREPFGVCARLVAYNHPAMFFVAKLAPAIATGNCVVMKAPDQAPLSSLLLMELLDGILPPGVLNLVTGGRECGEALTAHPKVAMVTLIGGPQTGRSIMRTAADRLKRVLLELGGKNALIAYPDADLHATASAAVAGMSFAWCGQSCGSTSRLFLHESIHDQVLEEVLEAARRFVPGVPTKPQTTMGALISRVHLERVMSFIESGVREGARLVLGGKRPASAELQAGNFLEPTIFADVRPEMRIAREEIFGPVLSVLRWSDEEEMLAAVNGVDYGLTAAVFTGNTAHGLALANRIEAGCIGINNIAFHALGSPFGGYKQSGIGREECIEELLEFTQLKTLSVSLGGTG